MRQAQADATRASSHRVPNRTARLPAARARLFPRVGRGGQSPRALWQACVCLESLQQGMNLQKQDKTKQKVLLVS